MTPSTQVKRSRLAAAFSFGKNGKQIDLTLRSLSFLYLGFLIILPIVAVSSEAFRGGLGDLWKQITLPASLFSLKFTFILAVVMVIVNVITGTLTAWVLVRYDFPLKNTLNALVDIPFAIPTVVTGMMLVLLYGPRSALGIFLEKNGIEVIYNKPGIVLALAFVTFPFVVRAVQPVLMEMDKDMEEAAHTLGASRMQIFRRVILPTLLPAILTGAALSFSRVLGEFGSIVIVAGNIPFKTQVSAVYIFGEIESANIRGALGSSVVLLVCSFLVLLFLNFIQRWSSKYDSKKD